MKCVRGLSIVALVSFLSANPGVAMGKGIEQVPNSTLSGQTKPAVMANIFQTIQKTIQTVDQVNQIRLREQRRQEEKRRRRELEAARREATEQQRLEAEHRRQYFENLSPEEQKTYLAEQEVKKAQADKAAALLLMMLFVGSTGSSDGAGSDESVRSYRCVIGYDSNGRAQEAYVQMTKESASSQSMCSPS
jgi:hypothetical protein